MNTDPRVPRCRVRDLASCFFACRLEEETDATCRKPPKMLNDGSIMGFATKTGRKGQIKGHGSGKVSVNVKRRYENGESLVEKGSSRGQEYPEPSISEKDYIVFCFRENGEIHMISEEQSLESLSSHDHHNIVNDQLIANTDAAASIPITGKGIKPAHGSGGAGEDNAVICSDGKKDDENGSPDDAASQEMKNASNKLGNLESCGSNISDASSASSFAFPELNTEWVGSPVHLPKQDNQDEGTCLHLQCCYCR